MPPASTCLIATQFSAALADNALLIVTIPRCWAKQGLPGLVGAAAQVAFTLSVRVLAPVDRPGWPTRCRRRA